MDDADPWGLTSTGTQSTKMSPPESQNKDASVATTKGRTRSHEEMITITVAFATNRVLVAVRVSISRMFRRSVVCEVEV